MLLSKIRDCIFGELVRPVKYFLAGDKSSSMEMKYYTDIDYEQRFIGFLAKWKRNQGDIQEVLMAELNNGADQFARQAMLALYSPNSKNELPRAMREIANNADAYPQVSEFLIEFFRHCVASIDVTDSFGETALAKVLKADLNKKTPLLFLVKHGAKSRILESNLQDVLATEYTSVYNDSTNNSEKWFNNLLS